MYHDSHLFRKSFLKDAASRVCAVFGDDTVDFVFLKRSKDFDVSLSILVRDIKPELVELIWRCTVSVEPDVSALRLSELPSVRLCDEWACECIALVAVGAAYKF